MQWHLRRSKANCLEILLKQADMDIAREALFVEGGWLLEERNEGRFGLAVFTRR